MTACTQMEKIPIQRAFLRTGLPTFTWWLKQTRIVEYILNSGRWEKCKDWVILRTICHRHIDIDMDVNARYNWVQNFQQINC